MNFGVQAPHSGGFTLIEVVIASALMALILASAYACLSAGYDSQKIVVPRTEILQNARVAMALMAADLRAACPLSKDAAFVGMTRTLDNAEADNVDFATHNYTPRRPREGDYCQESFFLDKDAETGQLCLYRRRNPIIAMDPFSGGSREEIARGVRGLKLEYYDGTDWYATWGETKSSGKQETSAKDTSNLSGLPTAVRITLYLDSDPHQRRATAATAAATPEKPSAPLVFQTVARLNLAEASNGSTSGSTSGSASGADASQDASGQSGSPTPGSGNDQ
jgi:prepilin-type N-terminal cleavage/methylation domain-containing protein